MLERDRRGSIRRDVELDSNLPIADFVRHARNSCRKAAVLGPGKAGQAQAGRLAGVEAPERHRWQEGRRVYS